MSRNIYFFAPPANFFCDACHVLWDKRRIDLSPFNTIKAMQLEIARLYSR